MKNIKNINIKQLTIGTVNKCNLKCPLCMRQSYMSDQDLKDSDQLNASKVISFLKVLKTENFINLENLDLAIKSFFINPKLTYFVASQILLSAFDEGADFLVVFNNDDFFIFNNKLKEIEKISNREIPLPIIHISELQMLASGDFDKAKKSFKNHKINPRII